MLEVSVAHTVPLPWSDSISLTRNRSVAGDGLNDDLNQDGNCQRGMNQYEDLLNKGSWDPWQIELCHKRRRKVMITTLLDPKR